MMKKHWVRITPEGVEVDGKALTTSARGAALLTEVYRARVNDYPKFFKMDELSKLGFLASELLLQAERQQATAEENAQAEDQRAVILFGHSGSISCDRKYQQTIARMDDFFPSPSIFVYTLPNIVTGEIAIRNHYHGETAFYALESYDEQTMRSVIAAAFLDVTTTSAICGWLDYESDNQFEANLGIYTKE